MTQRKRAVIIIISSILALLFLLLIGNSIAKSNVQKKLIGKVFEGTYEYNCRYFDTNLDIRLEIIDEKYCNVFFDYECDYTDNSKDQYWQEDCYNVPYKLSGGIFGVKFEWSGAADNPAEPFEVNIKNGEIKSLFTGNYNSYEHAMLWVVSSDHP